MKHGRRGREEVEVEQSEVGAHAGLTRATSQAVPRLRCPALALALAAAPARVLIWHPVAPDEGRHELAAASQLAGTAAARWEKKVSSCGPRRQERPLHRELGAAGEACRQLPAGWVRWVRALSRDLPDVRSRQLQSVRAGFACKTRCRQGAEQIADITGTRRQSRPAAAASAAPEEAPTPRAPCPALCAHRRRLQDA
ncbi:unnamed protein product [Prorocentrum cordatum]|uniref:Uncharacterized protein n=1 Tax=Prorocentrum cordatum TaxID=2364126 RepID=A0ABN9VMA9_9DINO|nr:unnamed protein product [Polarella glacialis]